MKWQRGHRSQHVEDRRGQRVRGGRAVKMGGGAAVVALLLVVIGQALGVDLSGLSGGGGTSQTEPAPEPRRPQTAAERELDEFVHFVIDDIQGTFATKFREQGKTYRPATLVLFTEAVESRCGVTSSAVGPFYCPPDHKAYIDLTFYRVLKERLGAAATSPRPTSSPTRSATTSRTCSTSRATRCAWSSRPTASPASGPIRPRSATSSSAATSRRA